MVTIGMISLLSSLLTYFLPESQDTELPQTMNEAFQHEHHENGEQYDELSQIDT